MKTIYLLLVFFIHQVAFGQLVINEVCSSNDQIILDEFGDSSDWIELYNSSTADINIGNYFLSDNPDDLQKWKFPSNTVITSQSYLLLFASGEDSYITHIHTNFKLSKEGERLILSKDDGIIIDEIQIPYLETDYSYGHQNDDELYFFKTPTPNAANTSLAYTLAEKPTFSIAQAFHDSAIEVSISSIHSDAIIQYTLDGSPPDHNSSIYTAPILVEENTIIRAIVTNFNLLQSPIATKSYFINEDHKLSILSIATHPDSIWNWERGIFRTGPNANTQWPFYGANYWREAEIPVHVEFFDQDKQLEVAYDLGLEIHGGRAARTKPQKPFRLLAKKKFGTEEMNHQFFEDRERTVFKRLVVRNASGDYNVGHCRDAFLHRLFIKDKLNVDALAHKPVVVYFNGVYWGVMNLREKSDEHYLKNTYGVDLDKLDLLEEDTLVSSGNFDIFNQMYEYVSTADLSIQTNFDQAASYFDVYNIADYFIVQTIVNNTDWPSNNIKFWRERTDASKWRYMLFDLDVGLGRYGFTKADANSFGTRFEDFPDLHLIVILKALYKNEGYRNYFINRYADILNTTFREENFYDYTIETRDEIAPEMPRHFEKWNTSSYNKWYNENIPTILDFSNERPSYAREYLQSFFDLGNEVKLSLKTYPEGAGKITISTISPELPWNGIYFNGVPVTISVQANEGYTFKHWESLYTFEDKNTASSIQYNFEIDDEIVAYFETFNKTFEIAAYINSSEQLALDFELNATQDVDIQLFDYSGRLIYQYPTEYLSGGEVHLDLPLPRLSTGLIVVRIQTDEVSASAKVINVN